ncbi:MAG: DUF6530 family protein [Christensenellaceae bacterium]|jgi:hypothetical protein|nr:DUF6530 family protein [Christensenellaceae bacterium]
MEQTQDTRRIPTHLKHKPVVAVQNYGNLDGRQAYHTDTQGLSIGLAQWNAHGKTDISAKVWRTAGDRWSRLCEELPIHRLLDLCILFCRTKQFFGDSYRFPKGYDPANTQIDRIGLQGDAMTVEICTDNEFIDDDVRLLVDALAKDDEMLSERLRVLGRLLQDLGYAG